MNLKQRKKEMKLKDYIEKRGIDSRSLAKRLGITVNTLRKAQEIPARLRVDILITIIEGTGGIVSANDLLGIVTRRPNYKSIVDTEVKPLPKRRKPGSLKLQK